MKILPINNIQNNKPQNFKAKFTERDINAVLADIKGHDADLYPKLYTLLERMNELSGQTAEFISSKNGDLWQVHIDNKSMTGGKYFIDKFSALYESIVNIKGGFVKNTEFVRMPESIFEQKWWENRFKTEGDVRNFNIYIAGKS